MLLKSVLFVVLICGLQLVRSQTTEEWASKVHGPCDAINLQNYASAMKIAADSNYGPEIYLDRVLVELNKKNNCTGGLNRPGDLNPAVVEALRQLVRVTIRNFLRIFGKFDKSWMAEAARAYSSGIRMWNMGLKSLFRNFSNLSDRSFTTPGIKFLVLVSSTLVKIITLLGSPTAAWIFGRV